MAELHRRAHELVIARYGFAMTITAPTSLDGTTHKGLTATVIPVADLINRDLSIPEYQRPYKWTVRNADQLLNDIIRFKLSGAYRLGTVIVHDTDIVDGQQRYLTLTLLLIALLDRASEGRDHRGITREGLLSRSLPQRGHAVSVPNLQGNLEHFCTVLGSQSQERCDDLLDFILDRCQVVMMELTELDAAFQMFDSQNTRGRSLYPTDLLKAFHIREMGSASVSSQLRSNMVQLWELIPPESVSALFSDYLFKIRQWSNGHSVPSTGFATRDVSMFKGIREGDPANALHRWSLPYLYAKNFTDDFRAENDTLIRFGALRPLSYPFQIDQPVINGETFFEFVAHYYRLGLAIGLFPEDSRGPVEGDAAPFAPATMRHLGSIRVELRKFRKDRRFDYILNLFDCLLLYYVDRFDGQDLDRALQLLLRFVMGLRGAMKQVQRGTVNNYALGAAIREPLVAANLFSEIRQALSPDDLLLRRPLPPRPEWVADYQKQLADYFNADYVSSLATKGDEG